jgi:LuxR family transcriptional regulator, maltose regulon positive regulatory protein
MKPLECTSPELPAVIPRDRLFLRLQAAPGPRVAALVGQAAQGKTTLAAQYLASRNHPAAWLHLQPEDADNARFYHLLRQALAVALPNLGLPENPSAAGNSRGKRTTPAALESALESVWSRLPDDIHIILDGLERLPDDAPSHRLIHRLICLTAEKGRIFMLSRRMPPYKLQQQVMRRQAVVIANDELAFTVQEIESYFSVLHGFTCPSPASARILKVTGGWPGGLVLVGQALNRKPRRLWADFLDRQLPSGLGTDAFEFFAEEVFEVEPRRLQDFLMQTAVMEVIDPRIAAHLFPGSDTDAILDDLVQRNVFIQVMPGTGPCPLYCLNYLFRDFLRSMFQARVATADQVRLYERIAGQFLQRRQAEIAVDFYLKADNYTAAARSIKKAGTDLVIRGRFAELEKSLAAMPAESVRADPWLLLLLTLTRRIKGGVRNVSDFKAALEAFRDQDDVRGQLFSLAYLIEALVFTGHDPAACRTWIARGEALLAANNERPYFTFARALLWLQIGLAYIASGLDLTRGISAARTARLLAHRTNDPRLKANADIVAVMGLAAAGDFDQADRVLDKITAFADTDTYTEYHTLRKLVKVALALHRGNLQSAREQLQPIAEEIETFGLLFLYPAYVDATGLLQIYLGEYEAARGTSRHLLDVAALTANPCYEGWSLRLSALRHYFQGRYFDAAAAAGEALAVLVQDDQPTLHGMRTQQLAALIEYHLSGYEKAHRRLQAARQYFARTGNSLSLCETNLSLALVASKRNQLRSLEEYLREGFGLAADRRYEHFVILSPSDLEKCCRLALDRLGQTAGPWPEHLLATKFSTTAGGGGTDESLAGPAITVSRDTALPFLEIRTLGTFRVLRDGRVPIEDHQWGGRRTKLLLKAIVVHAMQDIPKDILIEDLWPESDPTASQRNFKVTLHRLRRILEPDLAKHSRSAYIHLKDNLISLDRRRCRVDVQRFLEYRKNIKRATLAKEHQTILELGRQAMTLYQGDFLAEDPYAPWVEMKRLALKDEYIATAMNMAAIYRDQAHWPEAAQCCRAALSADPCLEQAGAMLMEILAGQDRRSDAVKVYEQLRTALRSDLGVEPDPGVTAVYRRIRTDLPKSR